jgi:hypothetical protein
MIERSTPEILGELLTSMGQLLQNAGEELQDDISHPQPSPPLPSELLRSPPQPIKDITEPQAQRLAKLVIQSVTHWTGIPERQLQSTSRRSKIVEARRLCWYLLRQLTNLSTPQLGQLFQHHYDHSTVIDGLQKIGERIESHPENYHWLAVVLEEGEALRDANEPPREQ